MAIPAVIIHELGHALHDQLDHQPEVQPVTQYARTNSHEAFAEAFTAWVAASGPVDDSFDGWLRQDIPQDLRVLAPGAYEMFDRLAL